MRVRAILCVLLLTAACDQETRAELAVLRERVISQESTISRLHQRVEDLAAELEKERGERREADAARERLPPVAEVPELALPVTPKCEGTACTLTRAEIDALLENPGQLAKQARIIPVIKDGKANGFKVFGIRAGSLFSSIGIQNGDTIDGLAGVPLTDVESAMRAVAAMKTLDTVVIKGTRKDQPFELSLAIAAETAAK
jgi:hypothetical protein